MNNEKTRNDVSELIDVAQKMINGELHLIEGVRKLRKLIYDIGREEDALFLPIIGVESETDHYPIGNLRDQCASSYLQEADSDMEAYLNESKPIILKTCQKIIESFS